MSEPVEGTIASSRARYLADRDELAKKLRALEGEGARLAYVEVAKIIGADHWKKGARSSALSAAIELVEAEDGAVFVRDRAVGVRRGTEADRLARNGDRAGRIEAISKRGLEDLARVDVAALDEAARVEHAARITQLGQVQTSAAVEGFRQIVDAQGALPGKEALKLFSRT